MDKYEYVIVGAGPSGLTLAYYLSLIGKQILIIEQNDVIGGDHRVIRSLCDSADTQSPCNSNGLFSEHSPRIYSNVYVNFISMLKSMEIDFYELFTPYNFGVLLPVKELIGKMGLNEWGGFTVEFTRYLIYPQYSKELTVEQFCNKYSFSPEVKQYLDQICRLTDGAGIDRYSLFQFFQLINQHLFYTVYQPKLPNDKGLLKLWKDKLVSNGVRFMFNTISLKLGDNRLVVNHNGTVKTIGYDYLIFAIPPSALMKIDPTLFGRSNSLETIKWSKRSEYLNYLPITFHWSERIELENKWIQPTDWGLEFIVMSDYMKFDDPRSKTVISLVISRPNSPSSVTGKTAQESLQQGLLNKQQFIAETFRQLKEVYPNLPNTFIPVIPKKNDYRAFVAVDGYNGPKTTVNNVYSLGCHNGNSEYSFTSMESAVTNAKYLYNHLINEMNDNNTRKVEILHIFTMKKFLLILFVIFLIFFIKKF